jgi:hypothetical protein
MRTHAGVRQHARATCRAPAVPAEPYALCMHPRMPRTLADCLADTETSLEGVSSTLGSASWPSRLPSTVFSCCCDLNASRPLSVSGRASMCCSGAAFPRFLLPPAAICAALPPCFAPVTGALVDGALSSATACATPPCACGSAMMHGGDCMAISNDDARACIAGAAHLLPPSARTHHRF